MQRRIEDNDDVERFLDLDREFHMLTYSGCALDPLNGMVTRLWNSTQHHRRMFVRWAAGAGCGWSTPSTG